MSNGKKSEKKIPNWALAGHRKPTTRREFLACGIIPFAAYTSIPSWMSALASSTAYAQTDCPVLAPDFVPFITIQLEGGAAMNGNFIPSTVGGSMLTSYDKLGMGSIANLQIAREFGNVPFAGGAAGQEVSHMLRGMRAAGGAALQKTAFVGAPIKNPDDAPGNTSSKFTVDGMLQKAGLGGTMFPILGTRSSATGTDFAMSAGLVPSAPLFVNSTVTLANALDYATLLKNNLNNNQKLNLTKLINNISSEQNRRIASDAAGMEVKKVLDCAGIKNEENITSANSGAGGFAMPANIATIWGNPTSPTARDSIFSSITYNVLMGNAGSGTLVFGDFDYHNARVRAQADALDLQAGTLIGRILATANALNKPVFIYVISNGSVSSVQSATPGGSDWREAGECGGAYMLAFDPAGRPQTEGFGGNPEWQIGGFTNGQIVDTGAFTGENTERVAFAALVNWLSFSKKLNSVDLGTVTAGKLAVSDVNKILRIKG